MMMMSKSLAIVALVACALVGVTVALPAPSNLNDYVPLPNTPENIATIASGNYPQNIEELSGQFEGDMLLTAEQMMMVQGVMDKMDAQRTGLIAENYRWPNNTVPIAFYPGHYDADQEAHVYKALRTIESVSCLLFVNHTLETNYVRLTTNESGCFSMVGHLNNGPQRLNLQLGPVEQGCFRLGTVIHEFLHTLGFYHMQSATERDDFVRIAFENLLPDTETNFNKYDANRISNFGELYDVTSIMHYSAYGFSKNGYATIIPHDISLINVMGQRAAMSVLDVARLNSMYCRS